MLRKLTRERSKRPDAFLQGSRNVCVCVYVYILEFSPYICLIFDSERSKQRSYNISLIRRTASQSIYLLFRILSMVEKFNFFIRVYTIRVRILELVGLNRLEGTILIFYYIFQSIACLSRYMYDRASNRITHLPLLPFIFSFNFPEEVSLPLLALNSSSLLYV